MAAPLKDEPALCRCPHCDRVHEAVVLRSAGDWAMQYRRLLLAGWIAVVLGAILAVASLEGRTTYREVSQRPLLRLRASPRWCLGPESLYRGSG